MKASHFDRERALDRLASETFDVLVIGGGITGVGVVLDAASRGLNSALVERHDFASGTSSRSSKLVHGGLRYLQQGEFGLVYESLAERHVLRRIAPHLVHVQPFLLPMFSRDGLLNPKLARALGLAMWQYDLTGGVLIGKRHKRLAAEQAHAMAPCLDADRLVSAYLYYDAHADDARLTLAIGRTAAIDYGATVVNHAKVTALHAGGATVETGAGTIHVGARAVVNATGVWSDEIRALDTGTDPETIRPAKGAHIVLPRQLVPTDVAIVIPVPKDRRSVFVVPWGEFVYVGTTDTDYDGSLDTPRCTGEDMQYLLRALNFSISSEVAAGDVVATWAGLRPLVRDGKSERTADLSRRHLVASSASGVVTVTGGKLTTYRRMAKDAVDAVVEQLGKGGRSTTKHLGLRGAVGWEDIDDTHLAGRYGSEARVVRSIIASDPSSGEPLVPGLPYLRAEALYAVRYEMACGLEDVLARRTRAQFLDAEATRAAAADVAALVATDLGWTEDRQRAEVDAYRSSIETAVPV